MDPAPPEPTAGRTDAIVAGRDDVYRASEPNLDDLGRNATVYIGCSGTLITPTIVATADHCRRHWSGHTGAPAPGHALYDGFLPPASWVFIEEDRRDPARCSSTCELPYVVLGPDAGPATEINGLPVLGVAYARPHGEADILLVRLNQAIPASLADPVRPLTESPHPAGTDEKDWWDAQTLRAAGWGSTNPDWDEFDPPARRQTECVQVSAYSRYWEPGDVELFGGLFVRRCTAPFDGVQRSGDSGGPVYWWDAAAGAERLVMVFSSGDGGAKTYYGGSDPYFVPDLGGDTFEADTGSFFEDNLADESARMLSHDSGTDGLGGSGRYVDRDGDFVPDDEDNCPTIFNPEQADDDDGDPWGRACDYCPTLPTAAFVPDSDGDGVGDLCDNCAATPNVDQANCNDFAEEELGQPALGDVCDPHACGETTPRTREYNTLVGSSYRFRSEPGNYEVAPMRVPALAMDRTGFRFCKCSAASGFDNPEVRDECRFAQLDGSGRCRASDGVAMYDVPETGLPPKWREITVDYSPHAFPALAGTGRRQEIADYWYTDPVLASASTVVPSAGRFRIRWDAEVDVDRWADTVDEARGIFWTHAYETTGNGTGGFGAVERRLQSHYVDGRHFFRGPPLQESLISGDCFWLWPLPGAPGPLGGPIFPRLPLAGPFDCLSFLTMGPEVWLPPNRVGFPDWWGPDPLPPWADLRDRLAAITPWEQELLRNEGLGVAGTPHWSAIAFAPDLSEVRGAFRTRHGVLEDAPLAGGGSLPPSRSDFVVAFSGREGVAWVGGGTSAGSPRTDLWKLDLATGQWAELDLGVVDGVDEILAIGDSSPTGELIVLYRAPVEGVDHVVLSRLQRGAAHLDAIAHWPLIHSGRTFAMAVGAGGELFIGSTGSNGWQVARLRRETDDAVLEMGLASGAGTLETDFFVADRLGVSTVHRALQGGAMNTMGIGLSSFQDGDAADVF